MSNFAFFFSRIAMHRRTGQGGLLLLYVLLLAACMTVPLSTPETIPAPLEMTPTVASVAETDTLIATLEEGLPLRSETVNEGFDGVQVMALQSPASMPPLWIAYSYGIRSFDPTINHFVALYTPGVDTWMEVARLELECADYVDQNSIEQVQISADSLWLTVEGGAGAHSGCFSLLRWDGTTFAEAVTNFNSSPGAGSVEDLDGDGQPEVVLNYTDPYVFCYACGVRLYMAEILRWDGETLVSVELTPLAAGSAEARAANDRAIALAQASLFPDALALIKDARTLAPDDASVYWNAVWIRLHAENRLAHVDGGYPLLSNLFYGDYAAALASLREFEPAQIFSLESPLIVETPAQGWVDAFSQYLVSFASDAIAVQPDLAAAHFLRGWGYFLAGAADLAVVDVQAAAALAPDDAFYVAAADYLTGAAIAPPTEIPTETSDAAMPVLERVRFGIGATTELLGAILRPGSERRYMLEIAAGQSLYITAAGDFAPTLLDAEGNEVTAVVENDAYRFDLPATQSYTLVLTGDGMIYPLLYIPAQTETVFAPDSAITEEIRFGAGETGATVEFTLAEGTPVGYTLGIAAGQHLFAEVEGNASLFLLDPEGRLVTPISGWASNAEFVIPYTGDFMVVVQGSGPAILRVQIPPR